MIMGSLSHVAFHALVFHANKSHAANNIVPELILQRKYTLTIGYVNFIYGSLDTFIERTIPAPYQPCKNHSKSFEDQLPVDVIHGYPHLKILRDLN